MNEAQKKSLNLAKEWLDNISDEQFLIEYIEILTKQKDETIKFQNEYIMQLSKEKCALQAKIDALMLEFCPEEMTKEQIESLEENQIKWDVQQSVRYSQELSGSNLTDSQWKQIIECAKYFDNQEL